MTIAWLFWSISLVLMGGAFAWVWDRGYKPADKMTPFVVFFIGVALNGAAIYILFAELTKASYG